MNEYDDEDGKAYRRLDNSLFKELYDNGILLEIVKEKIRLQVILELEFKFKNQVESDFIRYKDEFYDSIRHKTFELPYEEKEYDLHMENKRRMDEMTLQDYINEFGINYEKERKEFTDLSMDKEIHKIANAYSLEKMIEIIGL